MPEHHKHGHRRHSSRHGDKSDSYVKEWFWACCYCQGHAAMSTVIIIACPGCQHIQCENCPMESVKIKRSRGVSGGGGGGGGGGGATNWTLNPVPERRLTGIDGPQQTRNREYPVSGSTVHLNFATSDANKSESTSASASKAPALVGQPYPTSPGRPDSMNNCLGLSTTPSLVTPQPSTSTSTPCSRRPSISFSQQDSDFDSATDFDSENTDSDLDGSDGSVFDDVGIDTAIRVLDVHLLSILNGDFDLAAQLIPKIHDHFNEEAEAGIFSVSKLDLETSPNDGGEAGSKGKERASESYASPAKQSSDSGSSPRKHARGSGNSPGNGAGNSSNLNKRSRRGRASDKGRDDDKSTDPFDAPDGSPNDPDEDPGGDPGLPNGTADLPDFACHFHKRDPEKYSPYKKKYAKCLGSCITELRRIKYHFKQVHRLAQCYRCYRLFQNHTELKDHYQEPVACLKGFSSLKEGIDDDQWEKIDNVLCKKGQKHISDYQRWYTIWDILFPDIKAPSNPWNVPPIYPARPTNVEEVLSSFEARIPASDREGTSQKDGNFHERYVKYLRQTLEELSGGCGMIQLQGSGKDPINPASFGHFPATNTDHMLSNGRRNLPLPLQNTRRESRSRSNSSAENSRELQPMGSWYWPGPSDSSMNRLWIPNSDSLRAPAVLPDLNSAFEHQTFRPSNPNIGFVEGVGVINEFWGYDPDTETGVNLEFQSLAQPEVETIPTYETNPPLEELIFDHNLGNGQLVDLLHTENERSEETATLRDNDTGNGFLWQG